MIPAITATITNLGHQNKEINLYPKESNYEKYLSQPSYTNKTNNPELEIMFNYKNFKKDNELSSNKILFKSSS